MSILLAPAKSASLARYSPTTHAADHVSIGGPRPSCKMTSGARYHLVVRYGSLSSASAVVVRHSPRSPSLKRTSASVSPLSTKMLSGFMSVCTHPCECRCSTAWNNCRDSRMAVGSVGHESRRPRSHVRRSVSIFSSTAAASRQWRDTPSHFFFSIITS